MLSVINDEMSKIGASETSAPNILTLNVTFVLFLDDIAPLMYILMSAYDITEFLRAAYRLTALNTAVLVREGVTLILYNIMYTENIFKLYL